MAVVGAGRGLEARHVGAEGRCERFQDRCDGQRLVELFEHPGTDNRRRRNPEPQAIGQ